MFRRVQGCFSVKRHAAHYAHFGFFFAFALTYEFLLSRAYERSEGEAFVEPRNGILPTLPEQPLPSDFGAYHCSCSYFHALHEKLGVCRVLM